MSLYLNDKRVQCQLPEVSRRQYFKELNEVISDYKNSEKNTGAVVRQFIDNCAWGNNRCFCLRHITEKEKKIYFFYKMIHCS